MTAIVFLSLRILLSLSLYAFLLLLFITFWKDINQQGKLLSLIKTPSLHLIKKGSDGSKEKLFFEKNELSIGRDPSCECQLDDDTVSNFHARLKHHHHQWWLEDLGSTNGTYINECIVTIPIVVTSGDEIRCGNQSLMVEKSGGSIFNSAEVRAKDD